MTPRHDIGILTTDSQLVVQSWDDWLAHVTSIPAAQVKGRPLAEVAVGLQDSVLIERFHETLVTGAVQVFSPALHPPIFPCALRAPSTHFEVMQQRITVGPLLDEERIAGLVITVQDVTASLDAERDLAAALVSEDPETRRSAAAAITDAGRVESLDSFSPALRSDDWRVRRAVVSSLAPAADHDLLRAVLATLRREHRNFSAVSSALRLLAVAEVDITTQLAELLEDPDPDLRIHAALALGDQHHPSAVPPLLRALEDPDDNVRFHAIESLGRLRADEAVDALVGVAESADFFLGFAAVDALATIGDARVAPSLVPLLANPAFRDASARALAVLGDERTVEPLLRTLDEAPEAAPAVTMALTAIADRLANENLDVSPLVRDGISEAGRQHVLAAAGAGPLEARRAAARILGWVDGRAATGVLGQLALDPETRDAAIEALVRIGEPALDRLLPFLSTEDVELRHAAITGIGHVGSERAIPALLPCLDDPGLAVAASGALAKIGGPAAFEPLFALVGHADAAVRLAAVGALNAIGHPEMAVRVLALLASDDPRLRESAVRIAGYFGYPDARPHLLRAASDPDESVRLAALEHLPFLDDERAEGVLADAVTSDTPRARATAARALGRLATEGAARALAQALRDTDPWVRYFAVRSLGELGGGPDAAVLTGIAEHDPSLPVRLSALESLPARVGRIPLEPLIRCSGDQNPEVAAAALSALGRAGEPRALHVLREASRAADPERRQAAARGLVAHATAEAVAELEWMAAADSDPQTADIALDGIAGIASAGEPGAAAAVGSLVRLLEETERCERAISAIAHLPPPMFVEVAVGLAHPHPLVRRRTVEALARARRPEATDLIGRAFADADPRVREAAILAITRLGSRVFDGVLRELVTADVSPAVRRAAAAALATLRVNP